mmetsp:Transcript_4111/g.4761  ORF Transcript_4111/g.4761 Transcript_4111/m.4761 type:complete len:122 (-) Transcript_4111:196-561(-)
MVEMLENAVEGLATSKGFVKDERSWKSACIEVENFVGALRLSCDSTIHSDINQAFVLFLRSDGETDLASKMLLSRLITICGLDLVDKTIQTYKQRHNDIIQRMNCQAAYSLQCFEWATHNK